MRVRARVLLGVMMVTVAGCRAPSAEGGRRAATEPARATRRLPAPSPSPTVVWIGGDVLLSGAMRRWVRRDGDPAAGLAEVIEPVARVWREDGERAFVLVNLESPVADEVRNDNDAFRHLKRGARRVRASLNAPSWLLDGLRRAGVDAVMLANNHALDQEREGLAETIDAAHAAGLVVTGAGRAPHVGWPVVLGEGEARTAVLTYFDKDFPEPTLAPGEAGLSVLGPQARMEVRRAAQEHAAVIVVVHVVAELLAEPKPAWRGWAEDLGRAGADVVAIHGTHVPGPVETLRVDGRDVVVAFGLGNFLSDMGARATPGHDLPEAPGKWDDPATREALLLRVEVRAGAVDARFLPTWMGHDRYLVHNRAVDRGKIAFELFPLAPCGPATPLPGWPSPHREEMADWLRERRDHLLGVAFGRVPNASRRCGEERLLGPPAFRGML